MKDRGIVKGENEQKMIKAGDAIFIAPNEVHGFQNDGEQGLGLLCLVPKGAEHGVLDKKFKPDCLSQGSSPKSVVR